MSETAHADEGVCPRCSAEDVEREVIYQTTMVHVSGVVFFCNVCGLTGKALSSDREAWFDVHKSWASPAVEEDTYEAFSKRWTKKVGQATYGSAEPLGPILPE